MGKSSRSRIYDNLPTLRHGGFMSKWIAGLLLIAPYQSTPQDE